MIRKIYWAALFLKNEGKVMIIKEIQKVYNYLENKTITQEELSKRIQTAAVKEWELISGLTFPINTVSQFRQMKLYCMIMHIFDGIIPTEYNVADIFHITKQSAISLLNSTISTYSEELRRQLIITINNCFKNAIKENDTLYIKIDSSYLINQINNEIKLYKTDIEPIKKLNSVTSYYKLSNEIIEFFKEEGEKIND